MLNLFKKTIISIETLSKNVCHIQAEIEFLKAFALRSSILLLSGDKKIIGDLKKNVYRDLKDVSCKYFQTGECHNDHKCPILDLCRQQADDFFSKVDFEKDSIKAPEPKFEFNRKNTVVN